MTWKQNLAALSFAQFTSMIGMSFFLPFIPLYLRDLGVKTESGISTWSGLIFAAGFLMLSLSAPLWGSLADRYGRKLMVLRAMSAAAIVLILTAFVRTPHQLLVLRLVHGLFSGFVSSAIALIASEVPDRSLGFGLGIFQSTITGGFIIGPLLGGVLQDAIGIRPTILIGGTIVAVGALLVGLLVREKHRPDPAVTVHSVWQNADFVFRNDTLWPAARLQFLSNMALMAVAPIIVLFVANLVTVPDRVGTLSGLVVAAVAMSMMAGAPFWGRLADRWGQRQVLTVCLIGASATFVPQALSQNVPQLFASRFLLGFFTAGIAPSLQALIANHAPKERRAGVLGISFSITLMGNAVGPLLGGALAAVLGIRAPFWTTAVILLGCARLSRGLRPRLMKAPPAALTQAD